MSRSEDAQGWQPIATAPRHQELVFWIVTKPDDEQWQDSLGRSVNYGRQPIATLHRGRYGSWAASMKATHWRYEFAPPALVGSPAAPEPCENGIHDWSRPRDHVGYWEPDAGKPCDCGRTQWGSPAAPEK